MTKFLQASQKAGSLNADQLQQTQSYLQQIVTNAAMHLTSVVDLKDQKQAERFVRLVQQKLPMANQAQIAAAINQRTQGGAAAADQSQTAATQPAELNYGAQPYQNPRFQQALQTMQNFQKAGFQFGGKPAQQTPQAPYSGVAY